MVLEMTKCEDMNVFFGVSSPEHALLFYFYFKAIRVLYKKKRITVLEIHSEPWTITNTCTRMQGMQGEAKCAQSVTGITVHKENANLKRS